MTKKPQSATADLLIALSRLTTVLSVIETLISELPDGQQRTALVTLCQEGKLAGDHAFFCLSKITDIAGQI